MNNLIIDNHVIKKDIKEILSSISSFISPGKFKSIIYQSDNVRITCPVHKDGKENKPSCNIYIGDNDDIIWGTSHCFACGYKGSLNNLLAHACDKSINWINKWLKDNFTEYIINNRVINIDDAINLKKENREKINVINDDILSRYQSRHPYMAKRKLTKDICEKYDVKYDPENECVVFPVRNVKGQITFLTRRSVKEKKFIIDKNVEKDVYLLYNIIKDNVKEVYVCESQINALTLESRGYRAIALLGTGSTYQYDLLKKSNIIQYHLCFDGDEAGDNGAKKFIENIQNAFIDIIKIPRGKDVNDLNKEDFEKLCIYS